MEPILIGRTPVGRQKQTIESTSVSRKHARLTDLGNNRWEIEDIGSTFGTMVNGLPIVKTVVGLDTPIILGHDFSTSVRELLGLGGSPVQAESNQRRPERKADKAEAISVAHLQQVYEDYQMSIRNLVKKKGRAQIMRMLPMQLLMPLALGASGILINDTEQGNLIKGSIMVGIMALTSVMSLRMISITNNQADEQAELTQQFQIDYVCPRCKHFFGQSKPYQALLNHRNCPFCKAEFIEARDR